MHVGISASRLRDWSAPGPEAVTATQPSPGLIVPTPRNPYRAGAGLLFGDLAADLVRDPSRRTSSQSCTGEFMSLTTSRRLVFESAGERDLLVMLDVDYRTVELVSQPERFRVHNGSRWTSYVPDVFAASLHGERCYFQVKPGARFGADPTLKGRIESIESESAARDAIHRLCPREALRVGRRLSNARWIHAAATAIDPLEARKVHQILRSFTSPCRLGELRAAGLDVRLRNSLLGLVGHREVAIALGAEIDDDLEVYW